MRHSRSDSILSMWRRAAGMWLLIATVTIGTPGLSAQDGSPRIFISVDLEGIGGVGSPLMTSSNGKDYGTARQLLTDEVKEEMEAALS